MPKRMTEVRYFIRDTISGPRKYYHPDGWSLDDTGKTVWVKLLYAVKERNRLRSNSPSRKETKQLVMADAETEILGRVLASTYGMASTYYILKANEMQEFME